MLLNQTFSELGRSTQVELDKLRRQLGVGIDPAYDYSQMTELQRKLASKKDRKSKEDAPPESGPLERLRRALNDATNPPPPEEPEETEAEVGAVGKLGSSSHHNAVVKKPSWPFRARSRNDIDKMDVRYKFRAPTWDVYKPKTDLIDPRVLVRDFAPRDATKSRTVLQLEEEVSRLQAENQPYEHLLKPLKSVELLDEKPERLKPRLLATDFDKSTERPDMVKISGIVFNDSSFTAGALSGDLNTSKWTRQPCFDFAKTSTAPERKQETFFEPGQYPVKLDITRPKREVKNLPFTKQVSRRPLRETVGRTEIKSRPGDLLPDRSLARSCPHLSTRPRPLIPAFDKYTPHLPLNEVKKPYHDFNDPDVDKKVLQRLMTHDEMEAVKATWKVHPVDDFGESLNRHDQLKIQRRYGDDILLALAKDNVKKGPVSVELLEMGEVGKSEQLKPRVLTRDFNYMAARERQKKHIELPPRNRDLGKAKKFERSARAGDSRLNTDSMSPSSGALVRERAARLHNKLDVHELAC